MTDKTMPAPRLEAGIRIPEKKAFSRERPSAWAFTSDMKVGESFFLSERQYNVKKACGAASNYMRIKCGFKAVWRTVEGGIRIWRTE